MRPNNTYFPAHAFQQFLALFLRLPQRFRVLRHLRDMALHRIITHHRLYRIPVRAAFRGFRGRPLHVRRTINRRSQPGPIKKKVSVSRTMCMRDRYEGLERVYCTQ